MNKYIEIWFGIHVSTSVNVHEKNVSNFFKNKMAPQNLANKSCFLRASLARPLSVAILHLEQKTRKILNIYYK